MREIEKRRRYSKNNPLETEIAMVDYVAMQAEECLEYSEEYHMFDDVLKLTPLCKFLRIIRNNENRMQKFLDESIHKYKIFKAFDNYQELEKKGIEIKNFHHLQILAPLCDKTATFFIELFNVLFREN